MTRRILFLTKEKETGLTDIKRINNARDGGLGRRKKRLSFSSNEKRKGERGKGYVMGKREGGGNRDISVSEAGFSERSLRSTIPVGGRKSKKKFLLVGQKKEGRGQLYFRGRGDQRGPSRVEGGKGRIYSLRIGGAVVYQRVKTLSMTEGGKRPKGIPFPNRRGRGGILTRKKESLLVSLEGGNKKGAVRVLFREKKNTFFAA